MSGNSTKLGILVRASRKIKLQLSHEASCCLRPFWHLATLQSASPLPGTVS